MVVIGKDPEDKKDMPEKMVSKEKTNLGKPRPRGIVKCQLQQHNRPGHQQSFSIKVLMLMVDEKKMVFYKKNGLFVGVSLA